MTLVMRRDLQSRKRDEVFGCGGMLLRWIFGQEVRMPGGRNDCMSRGEVVRF